MLASDIALDLIYSDRLMTAVASVDPVAGERDMWPALVHSINRLALLKLDTQSRQVQVHRLLQEAVRNRMSPAERDHTRHEVHLALAAFRPSGEPDDPATWDRFRIIWQHLRISEAEECNSEEVRALVIARVRYMWRRGDFERGRTLGLRVARQWEDLLARTEAPGEPATGDRRPGAAAATSACWSCASTSRTSSATRPTSKAPWSWTDRCWPSSVSCSAKHHANTLRTMGSYAADLRALGRYRESLPLAEANYQAWRDRFGETDLRTLAAANNLAEALRTVGDFTAALIIDEDVYDAAARTARADPSLHAALAGRTRPGPPRGRRVRGVGDAAAEGRRAVVAEHLGDRRARHAERPGRAWRPRCAAVGEVTEAAELLEAAYGALTYRFGADSPSTLACG